MSRGAGEGWNLIGNPLPCPIAFGKDNSDSNEYPNYFGWIGQENLEHKTLYVTTGGTGETTTWDTYNGTSGIGVPSNNVRNIAPGQGFWVKANTSTSLGLNHYAKTQNPSTFKSQFKTGAAHQTAEGHQTSEAHQTANPSDNFNIIRVSISNDDNRFDQTAISYNKNACNSYESYDSERFQYGSGSSPQIATIIDDKYCAINTLNLEPCNPAFAGVRLQNPIPLSYYSNQPQHLKISLPSYRSSPNAPIVRLEDLALGIVHDLSNQPVYEFHTGAGVFDERFQLYIKLSSNVGLADLISDGGVYVIKKLGEKVLVESVGPNGPSDTSLSGGLRPSWISIRVIDLQGSIRFKAIVNELPYSFSPILQDGVYIIQVKNGSTQESKKVHWVN